MKTVRIPISKLAVASAFLSLVQFSGGIGATVFLTSLALTAMEITRHRQLNWRLSVIASFLLNATYLALVTLLVLPTLKYCEFFPIDNFFLQPIQNTFKIADSLSVSNYSRELSQIGSLTVIGLPALIVLLVRFRRPSLRMISSDFSIDLMFSPPFLTIFSYAVMKFVNPWNILAPIMSGDGRNNFLLTMSARSSALKPLTFIDVGILPNSLASFLSGANGSSGVHDVRDLWAISFVWMISTVIIALALSHIIELMLKLKEQSKISHSVVGLISIVFATNPALLSFCLNDGFFSLYFAVAILSGGIAIALVLEQKIELIVLIVVVSIGLMLSYILLLPAFIGFVLPFIGKFVRKCESNIRWNQIQIVVSVGGLVFLLAFGGQIWRTYLASVTLSGAFIPMAPTMLSYLVTFQFTASKYCKKEMIHCWQGLSFFGLATLIQYSIIEITNGSFFDATNSYYGTKILVATSFVSVAFSVPLFVNSISVLMSLSSKQLGSWLSLSALVCAMSLSYFVLSSQTRLPSPIPMIINGWGYPDSKDAQQVVSNWSNKNVMYVEFSKSPSDADGTWRAETQAANDRILNFWSPIFWNVHKESNIGLYNWIYGQWNPTDLNSLCPLFESNIDVVVTRSMSLKNRLSTTCVQIPEVEVVSD